MPSLQASIMHLLYGHDIWQGFEPKPDAQMQGWNGDHPSLSRLAGLNGAKLVVDVGVWKGQSTINMASAMKDANLDGCIIAVDTFLGSPEHWDASHSGQSSLFSRVNGMPDLYSIFMSNAHKAGVSDYIVPMPQTSVTAANILHNKGVSPSLVHIDAAHEYEEVMRDAEEYWKILSPGGYMIGDDYHFTWPGVVKAAGEFSAKYGRPLSIETIKWIVDKPDVV